MKGAHSVLYTALSFVSTKNKATRADINHTHSIYFFFKQMLSVLYLI